MLINNSRINSSAVQPSCQLPREEGKNVVGILPVDFSALVQAAKNMSGWGLRNFEQFQVLS